MKKFIKQFFCKHNWERFYVSLFKDDNLHIDIWYYDDYQIDKCNKCDKRKSVNEYENE